MKKHLLLSAFGLLFLLSAFSQNIAINADGSRPDRNAILDIQSGTKGLLIPRMGSSARLAIPNTRGLLVFDTTTNSFWYNTGTEWQNLLCAVGSTSDLPWLLAGNANATAASFLGTTRNVPLNIRVNNQPSGKIDSGKENTYWGYFTGAFDSVATDNVGIGAFALQNTVGGGFNTATGARSMISNTSGSGNVATGYQALNSNTEGTDNVAEGFQAMYNNNLGLFDVAIGSGAMFGGDETACVAIGFDAMHSNRGNANTAIGYWSMLNNTTGTENVATGFSSLMSNTTGVLNTADGYTSMQNNTTGDANTAVGYGSLSSSNGTQNTAMGLSSMFNNGTGNDNTACGALSLNFNISGNDNTGIGESALTSNTTGSNNTALGFMADVASGNLTNATALGFGAIVDASNKVRIGNGAVTVIEGQVPFTTPSDGRYKFNVQENVKGLDFILKLRPVTYQFDVQRFDAQLAHRGGQNSYAIPAAYAEATRIRRSGFIAQEVEKAAAAADYDFSGIVRPATDQDHYSLSYDAFVVPLVKAVQEQQQIILEQDRKIADLVEQNKKIADLQEQIDEIKKLLK
jgi:hypothetical protein